MIKMKNILYKAFHKRFSEKAREVTINANDRWYDQSWPYYQSTGAWGNGAAYRCGDTYYVGLEIRYLGIPIEDCLVKTNNLHQAEMYCDLTSDYEKFEAAMRVKGATKGCWHNTKYTITWTENGETKSKHYNIVDAQDLYVEDNIS